MKEVERHTIFPCCHNTTEARAATLLCNTVSDEQRICMTDSMTDVFVWRNEGIHACNRFMEKKRGYNHGSEGIAIFSFCVEYEYTNE